MTDQPDTYTPPTGLDVTVGGQPVRIERISARKSARILAILRAISKDYPEVLKDLRDFRTSYPPRVLSRAEAEREFGAPRPISRNGEPLYYPDTLENGEPHPVAGQVMTVPGELEHMTEEAWAAAGQTLSIPQKPKTYELVGAVAEKALEKAEAHVYRLLALFLIPNATVKQARKDGTLDDLVDDKADDLLDDAFGDELLEIAVAAGELVDAQFMGKARALGARLPNALRLVGLNPEVLTERMQTAPEAPQTAEETGTPTSTSTSATSPETASSSRPTSPTDSGASSDGTPTPSSSSPGTSSAPSTVAEPASSS